MKRIVIGLFGLALVLLVIIRVIQATADVEPTLSVEEIRRQTGVPVEVSQARVGPLVVRREFTGTMRGIRSATIRARTEDEIVEIPVVVGQRVRAGAVMIRQASEGSRASVRQAEAAWEQARRNVERLRPLRAEGAISEQDWDNAVTALTVAEANVDAARRAVVLTSPIDGVVTDILETRGTVPSLGDPLVRVSDLSRVQVLVQVSPQRARELALGQEADLPEYGLNGQVSRIALQADPESRLLEVELTFPGRPGTATSGDRQVVPGALVTVHVVVGQRDSALLIPRAALNEGTVWVVDEQGRAHQRSVRRGLEGADAVEVLEGISANDRVVVSGASLLSDGVLTRIIGESGS